MNYTVHVNRRQLPSFMSPQLQLFDARSPADRWTVRVSRRARRLSVRVYPGGRVEVVVPPGASPRSGAEVHRHAPAVDPSPRRGSLDSRCGRRQPSGVDQAAGDRSSLRGRVRIRSSTHRTRARRRRERLDRERAVARRPRDRRGAARLARRTGAASRLGERARQSCASKAASVTRARRFAGSARAGAAALRAARSA